MGQMGSKPDSSELVFTGERVVPGKTPRPLVLEHLARYRFALGLMNSASRVLDVGCGSGYGTALLAERAARVTGIDIAFEAVQFARSAYARPNLSFACADSRMLPFRNGGFTQAVMFEVIEHVSEQSSCLGEIRRVLAPDGTLILSTPNVEGPTKSIEEPNPFHQKELSEPELLELLQPHFDHVQVLYQREVSASSIEGRRRAGKIASAEIVEDFSAESPVKYFVAVCSHQPVRLPSERILAVSGIEHQIAVVQDLRSSQREIKALLNWREEAERDYAQNIAAHQAAIAEVKAELARHVTAIEQQNRDYAQNIAAHREIIERLGRELIERDTQLNALRGQFEARTAQLEAELAWLYRWLPVNRLARNLFYGRDLRRKIRKALGLKG